MKLKLDLLQKLIELPSSDSGELRQLLDDVGLEVKDVESRPGGGAVFTIETLANRGDHLHAIGIARELSARLLKGVKHPSLAPEMTDRKTSIPVRRTTDKCLRYALMEMSLPRDMKLRPDVAAFFDEASDKHAIVDLLNYIQQEMGQPMHAFDRDKVEGEVLVELSSQPEKIEALDGKTYEVPPGSILIRDKKKIIAVAGVIGCSNSMVTEGSQKVLIESATFDPVTVRKTARAMGISTDASFAFERGCDPEGVIPALRRLVLLAGGTAGVVTESQSAHVTGLTALDPEGSEKRHVTLRLQTVRKQINSPRLEEIEVLTRLKNLGYNVAPSEKQEYKVAVPSWRYWDVKNEEDLVEDFARAHGYNRIKLSLPPLDYEPPEPDPIGELVASMEPALHGNGFYEVITRSFYSMEEVKLLSGLDADAASRHVGIKNSVEKGISHMRISGLLHLARLAEANCRKGILSFKAYEIARVFQQNKAEDQEYEHERDVLNLGFMGRWYDNEYQKPESGIEALRLFKGTLISLFRSLNIELGLGETKDPFLHPGYRASIKAGRNICGSFGLIHPQLKKGLDLKQDFIFAEIDLSVLLRASKGREFIEPVDFPAIRRDVTLKVGLRDLSAQVCRNIFESKPDNLSDVTIVDHFRKDDEDFRRVTYRLTFQNRERTLEHSEVDKSIADILASLKSKHQLEMA